MGIVIEDISKVINNSYRIAEVINEGKYNDILYYEFHEYVNPEGIYNCLEGLDSFQERSQDFYKIFLSHGGFVDEEPSIIHVAVKVSDVWFIAKSCGYNYYSGYGPQGILNLREACAKNNILGVASVENFDDWLVQNFKSYSLELSNKNINESIQFDKLIKSLRYLAINMQRTPDGYNNLKEEDLRDKMLIPINAIFEGRASGETKNCKGKTDILVRTSDGLNEFIFELKVWKGIKSLENTINQLRNYLSWHNNFSGIIMFCYQFDFTKILKEVDKFLNDKFSNIVKDKNNEFRFRLVHPTDNEKVLETHLFLINLKTI